jgi:hypothetical protein
MRMMEVRIREAYIDVSGTLAEVGKSARSTPSVISPATEPTMRGPMVCAASSAPTPAPRQR